MVGKKFYYNFINRPSTFSLHPEIYYMIRVGSNKENVDYFSDIL